MATATQYSGEQKLQALLDRQNSANFLGGVSLRTMDNLVSRGDLKPVKILGRTMFRRADLMKLAKNGTR